MGESSEESKKKMRKDTMESQESGNREEGLIQRSKLIQEMMMSRPLRPCVSAKGTKRLRGDDDEVPVSGPRLCTMRVGLESDEDSLASVASPLPSSSSSSSTHSSLMDLPDVMLLEILLRLPVKSTFRCKSLSKRCCSLISGYYSSSGSFSFILQFDRIIGHDNKVRHFEIISDHPSFCEESRNQNLDLSFLPYFPLWTNEDDSHEEIEIQDILPYVDIEATCNGLLLCSFTIEVENEEENEKNGSSLSVHYFICNVVSRRYVALPPAPPPPPPPSDASPYLAQKVAVLGFLCEEKGRGIPCSYQDSTGTYNEELAFSRYVVVRFPGFYSDDDTEYVDQIEALIFCSETGCWSTSNISTHPRKLKPLIVYAGHLIPYKNKLHWLTKDCIAVYDPFKNRERFCRIIDLPDAVVAFKSCRLGPLGVCGNRLRFACGTLLEQGHRNPDDPALRVWELEDYDRGGWCLAFKLSFMDVTGPIFSNLFYRDTGKVRMGSVGFSILGFHPYKRELVYISAKELIICCNMQTRTEEEVYRLLIPKPRKGFVILDSRTTFQLVHLWSSI